MQGADLIDHALAHNVVRQTAERLGADNVAVAALDQLDHLGGQQPALAHLGTQRDDALGLFHQLAERAGRVEAVLAHGVIAGAADAVQPAQERVRAARHKLVAAVQVDVQLVVGHAVLHKAHQAGQVDLAVLAFQKFFQIIVAQRRVFDINLADDADLDLRHAGDGNGRVVRGNVVEPALHVMGGVVLVVADPALYRRDPLLGHGVGVAPVVLVGVGLAAQGDQHIAVKDRRNDLAQQRYGQRLLKRRPEDEHG